MRDKSDMGTAETYSGIGRETHHVGATGASTTTSIPESSPLSPTTGPTGRETTTGAYNPSRFGTGANTGVIDPNLTTARPTTISGTGIHAHQYRGREGEYGLGTTTTVSSGATPGIGHHVPHHHHHGHHAPGDTSTGLLKFVTSCIVIPLIFS